MLFQTPSFFALLALALAAYYAFPRRRLAVLIVAGVVFYTLPDPAHLGLLVIVSLVTYACALGARGRLGGWLFALGLAVNAANLVFFKYALFLLRSVESLAGLALPALDGFLVRVVLPVGVSFYTFQLIAYLVDVRRGRIPAERSAARFWVFVSLFPKLVAGPIVRGGQLLPQLERLGGRGSGGFDAGGFGRGLALFLFGLLKKVVLADTLAPYVARLFAGAASAVALGGPGLAGAAAAAGGSLSPAQAWLAAYLFAFQIYLDFSAYSDMAVGVGRLFGLDLPQNFRTPYLASGPAEFWRRWHVTLSEWIRDYVYIPLGGSRLGLARQLCNLVLAMAFSGLWHGAGWTFVVWGIYHGLLAAVEKVWWRVRDVLAARTAAAREVAAGVVDAGVVDAGVAEAGRLARTPPRLPAIARRVASVALCFHAVVFGWVFFRAPDLRTAIAMVKAMVGPVSGLFGGSRGEAAFGPLGAAGSAAAGPSSGLSGIGLLPFLAVPCLYLLHVAEHLARRDDRVRSIWVERFPAPVRGLVYALAILLLMVFTQTGESPFIYSKF